MICISDKIDKSTKTLSTFFFEPLLLIRLLQQFSAKMNHKVANVNILIIRSGKMIAICIFAPLKIS